MCSISIGFLNLRQPTIGTRLHVRQPVRDFVAHRFTRGRLPSVMGSMKNGKMQVLGYVCGQEATSGARNIGTSVVRLVALKVKGQGAVDVVRTSH